MIYNKKEKISISLSVEVLSKVDQEAKKENRKRSNYIDTVLRKYLGLEEYKRNRTPFGKTK